MLKHDDVVKVLSALGENFLVDIEAVHDGKGGYLIEFTTLANALVNPAPAWVDEILGYANTRDYEVGAISPGGAPVRAVYDVAPAVLPPYEYGGPWGEGSNRGL